MANQYLRAMRFEHPDEIPIHFSFLPAAWLKYGAELQRILDDYPTLFQGQQVDYSHLTYAPTYHVGTHIDEWGCVWENIQEGAEAIVTGHPVTCEEDVFTLKIPENRDGRLPHGFMYLRLLDLCGFELAMELFAEENEALTTLIRKVLTYNQYQVEAILPRCGEVVYFGDDQGMQHGLAIGARRWRTYLKPCYQTLYGMVKAAHPDALVYMHTDGCIYEIIGDLAECGVDIINPQYRANGLDNLIRVCRSERRIAVEQDMDRQLFPVATPSELDSHVYDVVHGLYLPEGGLTLQFEIGADVPLENVAALCEASIKYRGYKGRT